VRVWLILLSLCLAGPALAEGQERFALVMGANLGEPGDEPLRFAEEDAGKMAQILSRFASVREENLLLLQGRSADRVEQAFRSLTSRIKAARDAQKETLLFVYYSGHADVTAMHLGRSRFEFDRLTELVAGAGATLKVLVVDACRSGELTRVKGARPAQPFKIVSTARLKSAGNAIITSSAVGEDAQESDRLGGGVFSHHFMTGLRGAADRSGDRKVSLSEAYRYAYDETLRTTSRARFLQHPTYAFKMKGREDLVLTRLASDSSVGRVRLDGSGTWLFMNQANPLSGVMEITTDKRAEVIVNPGRYLLRLRTPRAVYEGRVAVEAGATQPVRVSQLRPIPYGQTIRKGYRGDASVALGLTTSTVYMGALTDGVGPNIGASVGVRADFRPLSLEVRLRGTIADSKNMDLNLSQRMLGGDVTVLKLFDPGYVSPGFGLRLGADWVEQEFSTRGKSPARTSIIGRAAPVLRVEVPISAKISGSLSAFVDGVLLRSDEDSKLAAVPGAEIGLTVVFQ